MGVRSRAASGEHVLRFRRFAEFVVVDGGRSIRWRAPPATRPETVRHLLLDQVLPAVAFEHSLIGLHASAVVIEGQGIAFARTRRAAASPRSRQALPSTATRS